jgi:beta-fructofuranosidase
MTPAPELEALRKLLGQWSNLNVTGDRPFECTGRQIEILVEAEVGDARLFGVRVLCSADQREGVWVEYDGVGQVLRVRRRYAETRPELNDGDCEAPLALGADETLRLRVFVDGSVIEVFAGDTCCLTTRFYATRAESVGVGVFVEGGAARVVEIMAWEMRSEKSLS